MAEVIRRLQRETANVAGIALFMQPVQDLSIDTQVSATEYQFTLDNQDLATLQAWTPKVLDRLAKVAEIVDVASDLQPNGRAVQATIDRRARRASASRRRRSTTRSTTPTASASSRPSSPSPTSIASFSTSTRR